jgi:hypothetical protein
LLGVNSQARKATMPFKAWNGFVTNEIADSIAQHENQHVRIIETNISPESAAKFTHKIDIKTLIDLLCLAGALRSNKQSLEELWGTDRDGIETSVLLINQLRFKLKFMYLYIHVLEKIRVLSVKFFPFNSYVNCYFFSYVLFNNL